MSKLKNVKKANELIFALIDIQINKLETTPINVKQVLKDFYNIANQNGYDRAKHEAWKNNKDYDVI